MLQTNYALGRNIHAQPGYDWTVSRLAEAVTMSPFRFAGTIQESPTAYGTKGRMNVTARLLANSQLQRDASPLDT